MQNIKRTQDDFYRESKRLRKEVLQMADSLKNSPTYEQLLARVQKAISLMQLRMPLPEIYLDSFRKQNIWDGDP